MTGVLAIWTSLDLNMCTLRPGMVACTFDPSTLRLRQAALKFQASLVNTANDRTARASQEIMSQKTNK